MPASNPSQLQPGAYPEARNAELRSNAGHSTIVDEGVALQKSTGTVCALEYLQARGVMPDVIARVLLHPGMRRAGPVLAVMHNH